MPEQNDTPAPRTVAQSLAELNGDPNAILKAYAAGAPFRAATAEELTTPDNPYRRPVRPDDLAWLDYSRILPAEEQSLLSGLLGHRMLRNVYDAEHGLLPPDGNAAARSDGTAFHAPDTRLLAALARPVLEHHLFGFLEDGREPLAAPTVDTVKAGVRAYRDRSRDEPPTAFATATSVKDAPGAGVYLLLQLGAFLPAAYTAVARGALAETGLAHPGLRPFLLSVWQRWAEAADDYRALWTGAGLSPSATAHWQFLLGSSLARGNHLLGLGLDGGRLGRLLGAVAQFLIERDTTAAPLATALRDTLGRSVPYPRPPAAGTALEPDDLVDRLLGPLPGLFGESVVVAFHEGFTDAVRYARAWDADLTAQLAWADRVDDFKTYAERIQDHLTTENIEVDLDTFVESHEETSTTHVHDDHRLVMVESGQMHFWHNVTHRIALSEGDKLLIPTSRLHGSVVLSGTCVYHQPIIPEGMFQKFTTD